MKLNQTAAATHLSEQYKDLEYFSHGLEILLHHVLDEEVEESPKPEDAVLPRVLSLLSSSKDYLDVVLQCTRKTEVRQWKTLFAYLPPPQELFEESLQRGSLKTAGGYLIILHTLAELGSTTEQAVRVLTRAMREGDWELCKELARFLAAVDETGEMLQQAMREANLELKQIPASDSIGSRLSIPTGRIANGSSRGDSGDEATESDRRSVSDAGSISSIASP